MEIAEPKPKPGTPTPTPNPNLTGDLAGDGEEEARRRSGFPLPKIRTHGIRVQRMGEMLGCHLAFPIPIS